MYRETLKRSLVVAMAGTLIVTSVAVADNLTVDGDILTAASNNVDVVRSGSYTARYFLAATGSDGCNADGSNLVTVTTSIAVAGAGAAWTNATTSISGCTDAGAGDAAYTIGATAALGASATLRGTPSGGKPGNNGYGGTPSADFNVKVVPRPPSNLTSPSQTSGSITLNWNLSPDDADITEYQLFAADTTGGPFSLLASPAKGSTTYTETGLDASSQRCYRLQSRFQAGGVGTLVSSFVGPVCASTQSSTPTDTTAPVVTISISPTSPDGDNDWYLSDVTVTVGATDASDIASIEYDLDGADYVSYSSPFTVSSDGEHTVSARATDSSANANVGSAGPVAFKIDKTKPTVAVTGFDDGATFVLGVDTLPTVGCSTSDATSGVQTNATLTSPSVLTGVGAFAFSCNGAEDNAGNTQSAAVSASYNVIYSWNGFFRPIDNPGAGPALIFNVLKAGQAVPIKFSLDGNYGLGIILSAVSIPVYCDTAGTYSTDTAIVAAGGSSLSYDVLADQYNYVWKTDKGWANSCRMLTLTLNDGTSHVAYFKLVK